MQPAHVDGLNNHD